MKLLIAPAFLVLSTLIFLSSCEKKVPNVKPTVEAGANVTIKLGLDSVLLSGTATDPDDKVIIPVWSELSGDPSATIENPTSLTTWVKHLKVGQYTFQLLATDAQGAFGTDTVSVTVLPADTVALSIQPDHNPDEVHIFGNTNIDQSTNNAPEIVGGSGTYLGDPVNIRALLKFDFSSIPSTATIISAKLTLYSNHTPLNGQGGVANSGADNALYLERVVDSWTSADVKWIAQPATTTDNRVLIPHTDEDFLDVTDLDIKDLVSDIVASGTNNGLMLKLKTEQAYTFRVFCSSKYSDATRHPKLEIKFKN